MLEKCLCKWDLFDGTFGVSIATCILSLFGIAWFLYIVISHEDMPFETKADIYTPYLVIIACVLMIIASILLYVALRKDKGWLVLIWLFVCGVAYIVGFLFFMSLMLKKDFIFGVLTLLILVAYGYCWLIVYSYYEDQYGDDIY